jgi:hypothetical protein
LKYNKYHQFFIKYIQNSYFAAVRHHLYKFAEAVTAFDALEIAVVVAAVFDALVILRSAIQISGTQLLK